MFAEVFIYSTSFLFIFLHYMKMTLTYSVLCISINRHVLTSLHSKFAPIQWHKCFYSLSVVSVDKKAAPQHDESQVWSWIVEFAGFAAHVWCSWSVPKASALISADGFCCEIMFFSMTQELQQKTQSLLLLMTLRHIYLQNVPKDNFLFVFFSSSGSVGWASFKLFPAEFGWEDKFTREGQKKKCSLKLSKIFLFCSMSAI